MEQKEIYEMRSKYANGYEFEKWCYTAEERDKWLGDVRSYAKVDKLVEIQQYTYVLKGEKIEYFGPETEK